MIFFFYCREHVEKALVDMQRFKEQKDKDLREALINYAVMQISMCKKVLKSTEQCQCYRTSVVLMCNIKIFLLLSTGNSSVEHCQRMFSQDVEWKPALLWIAQKSCLCPLIDNKQ